VSGSIKIATGANAITDIRLLILVS